MQDTFYYTYKSRLTNYNAWEGQTIHVKKAKHLKKPINIGNIYRPPKNLLEVYNEFNNEFVQILDTLETKTNEAIITGDFNINLLKINEKHVFSE